MNITLLKKYFLLITFVLLFSCADKKPYPDTWLNNTDISNTYMELHELVKENYGLIYNLVIQEKKHSEEVYLSQAYQKIYENDFHNFITESNFTSKKPFVEYLLFIQRPLNQYSKNFDPEPKKTLDEINSKIMKLLELVDK